MTRQSKWFFALMLAASLLVIGVCFLFAPRVQASEAAEVEAISQAMKAVFDRPDARLRVDPITIEGDAAVAGWSQSELGGRAFLRKRKGEWVILLCSGDQLLSSDTLVTAGLPGPQAVALVEKVALAEKSISKERLALFAKFDGLLKVEGHQGHHAPKAHNH